jgi:SPP1 family predicted phage head-tail adaptor
MRAGKLDRTITIQSLTTGVDDYGTPTEAWTDVATVRAELIQAGTEEFLAGYGESDRTAVIFRTRWRVDVTTDQRIMFGTKSLNIREIKEIGRRRGLELRCEEVRT